MVKITQADLVRFVNLTGKSCYHEQNKEEYRKLGQKILKAVADQIGLKKGEFDIRWNSGGIDYSGEHTLHTDKFYLAFYDNYEFGWFYWRTCKGRKDYIGGRNQCVPWTKLTAYGLDYIVRPLKIVQEGQWKCPVTGDIILNINQALRMACNEIIWHI